MYLVLPGKLGFADSPRNVKWKGELAPNPFGSGQLAKGLVKKPCLVVLVAAMVVRSSKAGNAHTAGPLAIHPVAIHIDPFAGNFPGCPWKSSRRKRDFPWRAPNR